MEGVGLDQAVVLQQKTRKKRATKEEMIARRAAQEETKKLKEETRKLKKELKGSPKNKSIKVKAKAIAKTATATMSSDAPYETILLAIQHFKEGGIHVLETLTEDVLNGILIETNKAYYNETLGTPTLMTDNEYDIVKEFIERKFPKNTVVDQVGAPAERNKVRLPFNMPSMDKIKPDTTVVETWKRKYPGPYVISCKLDGVSGLYTTTGQGNVPKLYTRGNGSVGQDVSHFIPYLNLPAIPNIVIRGEFIMLKATFSEKYQTTFANPRNLVAGIINRQTIDEKIRDVHFVGYEVIIPSAKPSEQMQELLRIGCETVHHMVASAITNGSLSETLVDWRTNSPYEIDGIIVADDRIYERTDGNPDHAFAFKMVLSEQMAEAKVVDVIWTASKDGYLKPRVQIEPIRLGGVTIEFATGFNAAFIETQRIGVGALIQLIRSGDVIPYIKSVISPAERPKMPQVEYEWNATHVDIVLLNKATDFTVRIKNIAGFFKDIEVDGLGEKNVERIFTAGFDTIPKIVHMTQADFLTVDGFKEKTATKLREGIRDKLAKASIVTLMAASGAFGRGFGERKIGPIMEEYPNILTSNLPNTLNVARVATVKGMSKTSAQLFVDNIPAFLGLMTECGLTEKYNRTHTVTSISSEQPQNFVVATTTTAQAPVPAQAQGQTTNNTSHVLYKKSVVMSGTRDKTLTDLLKGVGATLGSSVSKNTFAVVTDDKEATTGKVSTARQLAIPIFTPTEFMAAYF
jgi:NAD-dependent DNA ligase